MNRQEILHVLKKLDVCNMFEYLLRYSSDTTQVIPMRKRPFEVS